jgi:hypothetical protein
MNLFLIICMYVYVYSKFLIEYYLRNGPDVKQGAELLSVGIQLSIFISL